MAIRWILCGEKILEGCIVEGCVRFLYRALRLMIPIAREILLKQMFAYHRFLFLFRCIYWWKIFANWFLVFTNTVYMYKWKNVSIWSKLFLIIFEIYRVYTMGIIDSFHISISGWLTLIRFECKYTSVHKFRHYIPTSNVISHPIFSRETENHFTLRNPK